MPQRIGRYEVQETLGKGGMGVVYRARDPELDRQVAIKVVLAWAQYDDEAMARFQREARVVARLHHRHIVTVFDAGRTEEGLPYFVMEFLEGTDLAEVLRTGGALSPARALRYALQVCDGLSYAHERDIVHRDIKPANLLITPDDEIKVVDFGIAKLVGAQITGSGVSLGTPLYMAPEQVAGKTVDHRADIFALGGVLYTLLAGTAPFEAPTLGRICAKIETEPPPPLAEFGVTVPPRLEAIIRRALEKDPERRYQSAAAMAKDLRAVQGSLADEAAPTVITPRSAPVSPQAPTEPITATARRPRRAVTLVVLGVAVVAAALWAVPGSPLRARRQALRPAMAERAAAGDEQGGADTAPLAGAAASEPAAKPELPAGPGPTQPTARELPGTATLYPASAVERQAANAVAAKLFRAIEARDTAAISRLYGGTVPELDQRVFGRLMAAPRARIRYGVEDVTSSGEGLVIAEVRYSATFAGTPGQAPQRRLGEFHLVLEPGDAGGYRLRKIVPR